MTIAGDGQPRSLGRTATAIQSLSPGYFPFVMATSIISTGTFLLGPSWLSRVLLVIASAGLVALSVALVIRLVLFRPSMAVGFHDPGRVFGFFAIAGRDGCARAPAGGRGPSAGHRDLADVVAAVWLVLRGRVDVVLTGHNPGRLQHAAAELDAVRSGWPLA
jgi:hypothetical protein